MEKEFSAALHPTQYGSHIKDGRHRATHINPEVRKLMDSGMSRRSAYRLGQEINIKNFNLMYNVECASGFHFFRTRKEAEEY